jgi:endonuclease/exonuclease/phosphatase family metal-dependent hydrolase
MGGEFREFPWLGREPDVRSERLCREASDPDGGGETTFLHCTVEGDSFAPAVVGSQSRFVVLAYNVLRGFEADAQIAAMLAGDPIVRPDFLLLSEVDRGCARTGFRNVARDYARALGYFYAYATEFVELPGDRGPAPPYDPPLCEHGNAIVSRWPLGNVHEIRHAAQRSWYTPPGFPDPDEPRLGGRVALAADARIGEHLVRLYALHLESTTSTLEVRDAQAVEIAEDALASPHPVIAGGDLNAYRALNDLRTGGHADGPTQAFLARGFRDAHASLPLERRATSFDPIGLVIDFVFLRGLEAVDADLCPRDRCGELSDHLPIWTTVALAESAG